MPKDIYFPEYRASIIKMTPANMFPPHQRVLEAIQTLFKMKCVNFIFDSAKVGILPSNNDFSHVVLATMVPRAAQASAHTWDQSRRPGVILVSL